MRMLVVDVAALGWRAYEAFAKAAFWKELSPCPMKTVFPALTCPVQASFRTGVEPSSHGMVANGVFDRALGRPFFWEQASTLFEGGRIWDSLRVRGGGVGQLCWQQCLGLDSDLKLSPGPVHKHHGGMIQAWHSHPTGLYEKVCSSLGFKFDLKTYWGPFASSKSTRWIALAARGVMSGRLCHPPELLLVYLPHLDYAFQKHGPDGAAASASFGELEESLGSLLGAASEAGYESIVFGDYAIEPVSSACFPNRILAEAGLMSVRKVGGKAYPDIPSSRAFAMVDHQVAHVYVPVKSDIPLARSALAELGDACDIHDRWEALPHPRSGELVLTARQGWWFAYPWWTAPSEAPDFARHIDIHNKPGYDPCELFMTLWPPFGVSLDTSLVRGTHGVAEGERRMVFQGSTLKIDDSVATLLDLAGFAGKIVSE